MRAPVAESAELRAARMFKKKKNKKKKEKEDAGASVSEFGMDFSDEEDEGAGAPVAAIVQENVTYSGYLSYSGIKRGAPLRKGTPKEYVRTRTRPADAPELRRAVGID